jgi:hypothetical protein
MVSPTAPTALTATAATTARRPVARRYVVAAHAVSLLVLPSCVWRILLGAGVTLGFPRAALEASDMPGWGTVYVIALSALNEALALLTLGLIRPWGEAVPGWVPHLGSRRIPPAAVVLPAALGGVALTVLWTVAVANLFFVEGISGDGWRALVIGCYLPLVAWGPLLSFVTYGYYRRRAA